MKMLHSMAVAALALAGGFSSEHHRGSTRRLFPRPSMAPQDSDRADPTKLGGVDRQAVLEAQAKRERKANKARRDAGRSLEHQHGFAQRAGIGRPRWAQERLDHLQANSGGA